MTQGRNERGGRDERGGGAVSGAAPQRPRGRRPWWMRYGWPLAGLVAAAAVVAAVVVTALPPSQTDSASGASAASGTVEPGFDRSMTDLLQLDDVRSAHEQAPGFSLTDQRGNPMTMAEFRGRAVVFTVNDDRCLDLCTLLAQDIVKADHDLGPAAKHIAFVSINANPYYPAVSDVASWTDRHHLGDLSNWYFGTGAPAVLRADWRKYGVPVEEDPTTRSVEHGSQIFFVSPTGREVALGQFGTASANTAPFAHAMAQMAVDLLPRAERTHVGGPVLSASSSGGALGSTPQPIALPALAHPGATVSTAGSRGRFTVLNFWSSSCTACVQELPDLEKAHHALGSSVAFLGDDVSDIARAGRAFATKAGVTYPSADDAAGRLSGAFRITGLPYTVVLDPHGRVVVRHAGRFTTEQLVYVVQTLQAEQRDTHEEHVAATPTPTPMG